MNEAVGENMIVGLDIGTSKVVAIVGDINPDGSLDIVGIGSHKSRGLKKGTVVNIESTVESIQRAIEEAELMAGCQIHSVYAGIAGSHIRSMNSHGIVAIRDGEVMKADIERVIDAAQAVAIPADQKVLHILPQEYIIDSQEGVKEPLGMSGVRLEAKVHLVTCAINAVQNIEKCIRRCGLETDEIILEQLASSYAVLTEDEQELGVCLVDIGGGTSDIAIFTEGAIRHTGVIILFVVFPIFPIISIIICFISRLSRFISRLSRFISRFSFNKYSIVGSLGVSLSMTVITFFAVHFFL